MKNSHTIEPTRTTKPQKRERAEPRRKRTAHRAKSGRGGPLKGLLKDLRKIQKEFPDFVLRSRLGLAEYLQKIAIIYLEMRVDEDELNAFCSNKFWDGRRSRPTPDKPDKLLYFLLLFVCSPDGNGPKDASFYKTALEALLVDGVSRDKIADEIVNRGGLRAIVDAYREKNRQEQGTADEEAGGGRPNSKTAKGSAASKSSDDDLTVDEEKPRAKTILTIREGDPVLAVEAEKRHMGEIMSTHLGGKVTLLIKRVGDGENGLKRFRLLTIMDD